MRGVPHIAEETTDGPVKSGGRRLMAPTTDLHDGSRSAQSRMLGSMLGHPATL